MEGKRGKGKRSTRGPRRRAINVEVEQLHQLSRHPRLPPPRTTFSPPSESEETSSSHAVMRVDTRNRRAKLAGNYGISPPPVGSVMCRAAHIILQRPPLSQPNALQVFHHSNQVPQVSHHYNQVPQVSHHSNQVLVEVTEHTSSECECISTGTNLTHMVGVVADDFDSDLESELVPNGFVSVGGYHVKEDVTSMLKKIFMKYKDIAKDSYIRSIEYRSELLDSICRICLKLEGSNIKEITNSELNRMCKQVMDLIEINFEVGWLKRRLNEIVETREYSKGLKEKMERNGKAKEDCVEEIQILLEKVEERKEVMAALTLEREDMKAKCVYFKPKMKAFRKSLGSGLF